MKRRSERESTGLFFFEGVHLLEEFIRFGHTPEYVFATGDAISRSPALIERCGDTIYEVTDSVYEKMTDENRRRGYCAFPVFSIPSDGEHPKREA